ncbi:MAG: DUF4440 domain-containing protein [Gemmatimonadales bacterium]
MKVLWTAIALIAAVLTGCQQGQPDPGDDALLSSSLADAALADTLKARIADAYDFSRPGVADRMSALYPAAGRVVSASGGQIVSSGDSLRAGIAAFWHNTGQNMRDAKWVWDEVYVDRLGPDGAVLTGTWSIPHLAPTGRPHVLQGAWTAVFQRIGGTWLIIAEHLSAPTS